MDLKQIILDKIELKNTTALSQLITQNFRTQRMLNSMDLDNPATELRFQHFLRGLRQLVSEYKIKEGMDVMITIIETTFDAWGYEISRQECFLLYHLKDLGKFRIKDDKYFSQMEEQWATFKDYKMEKDEFKQSLKDLKNIKFIDLRRGAITFNPVVVLR